MTAQPRLLMALILVLLIPTLVFAGSTVRTRATVPVSVATCLQCDGDPLSEARLFGGFGITDATIEFIIEDANGVAVPNFPMEDIWISSPDLVLCSGTHIADFSTNANGYTEISGPLCGGDVMEIPSLQGFISGALIVPNNPIPFIQVNSVDLNGSLTHDLVDFQIFVILYSNEVYDYDIDYNFDGDESLIDLVFFATHYSHSCP